MFRGPQGSVSASLPARGGVLASQSYPPPGPVVAGRDSWRLPSAAASAHGKRCRTAPGIRHRSAVPDESAAESAAHTNAWLSMRCEAERKQSTAQLCRNICSDQDGSDARKSKPKRQGWCKLSK